MGKEMLDSEIKRILRKLVEDGGKVWVAKRIGKRISYIEGLKAGKESFLPPEIIWDDGEIVVFAEKVVVNEDKEKLLEKLSQILKEKRGEPQWEPPEGSEGT